MTKRRGASCFPGPRGAGKQALRGAGGAPLWHPEKFQSAEAVDFVRFAVDKCPPVVIHCQHQLNILTALMEKSTADVPDQ